MPNHEQLEIWIRETPWLMAALERARAMQLKDWCIAAGAVRNLVWDRLHGLAAVLPQEIDLIHHEPALRPAADGQLAFVLAGTADIAHWDVTNQALVHQWYIGEDNNPIAPISDTLQGMCGWPETATAVGVRLDANGRLQILAPFGLDDLFALKLRHNPVLTSRAVFTERIASKAWLQRWPLLEVLP